MNRIHFSVIFSIWLLLTYGNGNGFNELILYLKILLVCINTSNTMLIVSLNFYVYLNSIVFK